MNHLFFSAKPKSMFGKIGGMTRKIRGGTVSLDTLMYPLFLISIQSELVRHYRFCAYVVSLMIKVFVKSLITRSLKKKCLFVNR